MSAAKTGVARRFAWLAAVTAGLTFPLIALGAVVRLNDAGLACPDWPLCFGQVTPLAEVVTPRPDQFRVALEVGHRYLAGIVSVLVLVLTGLAWTRLRSHRVLRRLATLSLALLVPQAILGGLTVLMRLAPVTVSLHLLFGNLFFASLVLLSVHAWRLGGGGGRGRGGGRGLGRLLVVTLVAAGLQIFLGGWVSSSGASMACVGAPPACNGTFIWPEQMLAQLHYAHRLGGFILAALVAGLAVVGWRDRSLSRRPRWVAMGLVGLVAIQILLGWYNVEHFIPSVTAAAHTAIGAAIFGFLTYLGAERLRAHRA